MRCAITFAALVRSRSPMVLGVLGVVSMLGAPTARAYDAGTTHAGLTERAALASSLGRRFAELFGLPSGIYETLRFEAKDARTTELRARLGRLDPGQGYAPDGGRLPALSWIVAGSVVEEAPPWRERNHFFDAGNDKDGAAGRGLHQGGAGAKLSLGFGSVTGGVDSLGGFLRGKAFDGTGMASTEWLVSAHNDLSLPRFLDARERAVSAASAAERESALAEALLVAGALLHVVEDAGEPAHVHNDFRTDLYRRGAPYEAFVAARFGRLAVPGPLSGPSGSAMPVAHLADLIHTPAGTGLADRTARRFFSLGVLASDSDVSRPEALPKLVAGTPRRGYLVDAERHHLARYQRRGQAEDGVESIRWDLDARCFEDEARILLPETARAALSALEHLFRDSLTTDGMAVKNGALGLGKGRLSVLAEDGSGARKEIASKDLSSVAAEETLIDLPDAARTAQRWAVVFRGVDGAGEPIVISIEHAGEPK